MNETRSQSVCEFNNPENSYQKRLPRYPVKPRDGGNSFISMRRASWNSQPGECNRLLTDPGDSQCNRDHLITE